MGEMHLMWRVITIPRTLRLRDPAHVRSRLDDFEIAIHLPVGDHLAEFALLPRFASCGVMIDERYYRTIHAPRPRRLEALSKMPRGARQRDGLAGNASFRRRCLRSALSGSMRMLARQRPEPIAAASAMYGLMSAAAIRYSTRCELFPDPVMTRSAQVRFSKPHVVVQQPRKSGDQPGVGIRVHAIIASSSGVGGGPPRPIHQRMTSETPRIFYGVMKHQLPSLVTSSECGPTGPASRATT